MRFLRGPYLVNPTLNTTANGRLTLDFYELAEAEWLVLTQRLITHHGFEQEGLIAIGLSEQIHQGFQCAEFSLASGWDIWSGYYLMSKSPAGDVFLRSLYQELRG
ncbi:hypothetical protein C2E19_16560 [Pseudomonas sp. DTU12.3]|nr:hypothetical protein C2E19_16560 [Pseudomonas sp. DTU12.3]